MNAINCKASDKMIEHGSSREMWPGEKVESTKEVHWTCLLKCFSVFSTKTYVKNKYLDPKPSCRNLPDKNNKGTQNHKRTFS